MPNRKRIGIAFLDAVDWIMNGIVRIVLFGILGISSFSLYDTYMIYNEASPNQLYSRYRPISDNDAGLSFGELMTLNSDVVGWLTLDDTNIDYPVVQGENNSYYLNRDALGNYSLSGSIFMDSENSPNFFDPYTLLYGHHMDYDVMFGGLDYFEDQDYFDSHRTGKLWIDESHYYELTVVSCLATDAYDEQVFCVLSDGSDKILSSLYAYLKKESIHCLDNLDENTPLLGLSTCTNAGTNARTLVFCALGKLHKETYADQSFLCRAQGTRT